MHRCTHARPFAVDEGGTRPTTDVGGANIAVATAYIAHGQRGGAFLAALQRRCFGFCSPAPSSRLYGGNVDAHLDVRSVIYNLPGLHILGGEGSKYFEPRPLNTLPIHGGSCLFRSLCFSVPYLPHCALYVGNAGRRDGRNWTSAFKPSSGFKWPTKASGGAALG